MSLSSQVHSRFQKHRDQLGTPSEGNFGSSGQRNGLGFMPALEFVRRPFMLSVQDRGEVDRLQERIELPSSHRAALPGG